MDNDSWRTLLDEVKTEDGYQLYRHLLPPQPVTRFGVDAIDSILWSMPRPTAMPPVCHASETIRSSLYTSDMVELGGYSSSALLALVHSLMSHALINFQDFTSNSPRAPSTDDVYSAGNTVIILDLQGDFKFNRLRRILINQIKRQVLLQKNRTPLMPGPGDLSTGDTGSATQRLPSSTWDGVSAAHAMPVDLQHRAEILAQQYLRHLLVIRPESTMELIATVKQLPRILDRHWDSLTQTTHVNKATSFGVSSPGSNSSTMEWTLAHSPPFTPLLPLISQRCKSDLNPSSTTPRSGDSSSDISLGHPTMPFFPNPAQFKETNSHTLSGSPPSTVLLIIHNISAFYWLDKLDGMPSHSKSSSVASLMTTRLCSYLQELQNELPMALVATNYFPLPPLRSTTLDGTRIDQVRPGDWFPFRDPTYLGWRELIHQRILVTHAELNTQCQLGGSLLPTHHNRCISDHSREQTLACSDAPERVSAPGHSLCHYRALLVGTTDSDYQVMQIRHISPRFILGPFGEILTLAQ
ncbi:hypothetical protein IWQ61_001593 [Dispira simplex]|nr:hypothetical protein IWQ61_001593 [Dispira simplex]